MSTSHSPSEPAPSVLPGAPAPGDAELRALFGGKRTSERHPCHVVAALEGARGPASCTVLDLSDTGALVQIDDPAFVAADRAGSLSTYLEMLQVHAKDGLALAFPTRRLRLAATLVRFTSGAAGNDATRVGLRFERALSQPEVQALRSGSALEGMVEAQPPSLPPTHRPRAKVRLAGLVFLALKPEVGPLLVGQPTLLGSEHVTLEVAPGLNEPDLRARLASGALFVSLNEGPHCLHETTVRVLACAPGPDGALSVTFGCRGAWSPALMRRLRSI